MTTEVLRNMLYARFAGSCTGFRYVVMDEVHYLADRFRGAVWEEVILHLPERRAAGQPVGDGEQRRGVRRLDGQTVRGDTTVVVDEHRPVPLWQHMMVGNRLFDLFDYGATGRRSRPRAAGRPGAGPRHIATLDRQAATAVWRPGAPRGGAAPSRRGRRSGRRRGST